MKKGKFDIIIIAGAPGSGKTTIANMLKKELNSPMIDLGWLREYHLDRLWKNASPKEAKMSFENLVFILKNYKKYGYKNVIVNDLLDEMIKQVPKIFKNERYIIINLILKNDAELKKRIIGERDSGFKDYKKAIAWNKLIQQRKLLKGEVRIDNTHNDVSRTLKEIIDIIT